MATNKTIQPTGTTITIPAFTDKPDARIFATDVDRITEAVNALNTAKQDKYQAVSNTFTKQNASSADYEKLGTVSLSAGVWIVILSGVWNSGKPIGIHVTTGDTATDTPVWSTETDNGNPSLSFAVSLPSPADFSVFSKGGTVKQVSSVAYRIA